MKLRLVEEHDVHYGSTRFKVERKASGWFDHWKVVNCYSRQEDAQATFDRFKAAGGEYWIRKVLATWTRGE